LIFAIATSVLPRYLFVFESGEAQLPGELVGRAEARGHLAWLEQKTGVRLAADLKFRSRRSSTAAPVVATLVLRDRVQAVIYAYEAGLGARG
jgi:hypothetical protein